MSAGRPDVRTTYTVTKLDGAVASTFLAFNSQTVTHWFFFFGFWSSTLFLTPIFTALALLS